MRQEVHDMLRKHSTDMRAWLPLIGSTFRTHSSTPHTHMQHIPHSHAALSSLACSTFLTHVQHAPHAQQHTPHSHAAHSSAPDSPEPAASGQASGVASAHHTASAGVAHTEGGVTVNNRGKTAASPCIPQEHLMERNVGSPHLHVNYSTIVSRAQRGGS
eukprot:1159162-Pelagomonas_calceolata.AAC.7